MMATPVFRIARHATLLLVLAASTSPVWAETQAQLWTSTLDGRQQLSVSSGQFGPVAAEASKHKIIIADDTTYQTLEGMGSSLEHTTCYNLSRLPAGERRQVIRRLVHPDDGINMNLMRICIGTPDFTGESWYSYNDTPENAPDPALKHFSIERDRAYILPVLKMALEENPKLRFYASPWSPPGWMTSTGDMIGGHLLPAYYEAYARYFVKFIQAYAAEGIPIHAVTIQNEPGVDRSKETDPKWFYPSCRWTGAQERDFIKNHLGPEFENAGIETEIWTYDHNYNTKATPDGDDPGIDYPRTVLRDPEAARYVDKVAFHGYAGEPRGMARFHQEFPDTPVLFTEGSVYGLKGAARIIELFRNGASSYNAWVTMIDENRGPNNGPFECSPTCVMLDTKSGKVTYRFDYYMYGQFMRFIRPGARRIECTGSAPMETIAFKNTDGTMAVVIVHDADSAGKKVIQWSDQCLNVPLAAKSVTTVVWSSW